MIEKRCFICKKETNQYVFKYYKNILIILCIECFNRMIEEKAKRKLLFV